MQKAIFHLLILMFFASCANDIELEQTFYQPKIVVDGWIENNSGAYVFLTQSSPYLTEYDSASIIATFLNHAKVTITTDSGEKEILTISRNSNFFPPFVYKTIKMKGKIGENYHLKIEINNQVVTASTTIPKLPHVIDISTKAQSDTTYMINAKLEQTDTINYYFSQIKILGVDNQLHASAFPIIKKSRADGDLYSIDIKRKMEPDPLNLKPEIKRKVPIYEYLNTDTVLVAFSAIDESSYKVLNAFFMDQLNKGNPFSFVEQQTVTNIVGGIGRWTGLSTVKNSVVFTK